VTADTAFRERLDPAHRALLDLIPNGLTDLSQIERSRGLTAQLLAAAAARSQPVEGVKSEDRTIEAAGDRPDLLIRLYVPDDVARAAPALLYIHGGGFVLGEVAHFDAQCQQMARGAGLVVASVEYRRAPEHPYPAPLHDSFAALEWLHENAAPLGLDRARIGVGGTSAGACLAAGVALLARDRAGPPIAFQFLEAPMLDHRGATDSSRSIEDAKVWNRQANEAAWRAYLGADHLERSVESYASPAIAADLSGLPPAYLCIGAHDIFRDEAFDYARRLLAAGVPTQFHAYEMGFHGSVRALPNASVSQRWRNDTNLALKRLASGTDT
jgi:acetyl esterase